MNATECGQLLAHMALYDNRRVADPDIVAWLKAIGDLPYADCEAAVSAHYGESTDRIMPGHIRQRVRTARRDRLERTVLPAPDPELAEQPGRYRAAIRAAVKRIADGMSVPKAIEGGTRPDEPPAEWAEARAALPAPEPEKPDLQQLAAEQAARSRAQRGETSDAEAS